MQLGLVQDDPAARTPDVAVERVERASEPRCRTGVTEARAWKRVQIAIENLGNLFGRHALERSLDFGRVGRRLAVSWALTHEKTVARPSRQTATLPPRRPRRTASESSLRALLVENPR